MSETQKSQNSERKVVLGEVPREEAHNKAIAMTGDAPMAGLEQGTSAGLDPEQGDYRKVKTKSFKAQWDMVEGDIVLVIGGFHLGDTSESGIKQIIADFREMGVQKVSPTHCTGERAIDLFAQEYGEDYIQGGVGQVIVVGPAP